jgi:acyl-CoA dehydrogenase
MSATPPTPYDRFVPVARDLGEQFAPFAAEHDREGTFVEEAFKAIRDSGYLGLAVPSELGGMGATIGEVAMAQAEMARHDASAALAVSMHLHISLFAAWRYRREMPGAEGLLKRIVDDRIVLVSTGGSDFTRPTAVATKVDGGYRVNGRKIFCSQVPAGDVFSSMFTYEDPDEGRRVLAMGVPVRAEGVEILDTWDTLGMRGTGSHDVQMTDVFVPDAALNSARPWGVLDPPLQIIVQNAMPVVTATYLGVAERARDQAIDMVKGTSKAEEPSSQRLAGLIDQKLAAARWSLLGVIAEVGDDPTPGMDKVVRMNHAKAHVSEQILAACDLALQLAGGAGFYRKAGIESAVRDVRGLQFHPLTPELSAYHAGKFLFDLPCDEM